VWCWPINVFGQSIQQEPEPAAVVEIGAAASRDLKGDRSSFGGAVAVEFTPIENWLEIEAGTTPLFRRHSTEWDTDLLFKKPWTLSEKVEFLFGVGPASRAGMGTRLGLAAACLSQSHEHANLRRADRVGSHFGGTSAQAILKNLGRRFVAWQSLFMD
jgi:hypothetical protein